MQSPPKPKIYSAVNHTDRVWVLRYFDGSGLWSMHPSWADAMRGIAKLREERESFLL